MVYNIECFTGTAIVHLCYQWVIFRQPLDAAAVDAARLFESRGAGITVRVVEREG